MHSFDPKNKAMIEWLAGIGAASATELADVCGSTIAAASTRLRRLEGEGLVSESRLLHARPALYLITRSGLRAAGRGELTAPRVSHAGFVHALECARVARALEGRHAGRFTVHSERELRSWERAAGRPVASMELGFSSTRRTGDVHRPDLALRPVNRTAGGLPIAVEIELTVKAPVRLRSIIRGWARCRTVSGVVYYAAPAVLAALELAVSHERASGAVRVLALAGAGHEAIDESHPKGALAWDRRCVHDGRSDRWQP